MLFRSTPNTCCASLVQIWTPPAESLSKTGLEEQTAMHFCVSALTSTQAMAVAAPKLIQVYMEDVVAWLQGEIQLQQGLTPSLPVGYLNLARRSWRRCRR